LEGRISNLSLPLQIGYAGNFTGDSSKQWAFKATASGVDEPAERADSQHSERMYRVRMGFDMT
jgi:hypothetical protein